jgi:energy-coupling factor transporter ATP-binding protein EcfA2
MPTVVAALLLTGAPGSGKSSVLEALSTLLEVDGVAFGALEAEQLAWGWPWLSASEWLPQLTVVISLQRAAGRRLFLVAATVETQPELQGVIDALAVDRVVVVCLQASPEVVARRIADREPDAWPGKAPLISHARDLAESIPSIPSINAILGTDGRSPVEVAGEVYDTLCSHGVIPGAPTE